MAMKYLNGQLLLTELVNKVYHRVHSNCSIAACTTVIRTVLICVRLVMVIVCMMYQIGSVGQSCS